MSRIAFDCAKCFRTLQLEERIYKKVYEGHTLCMSCRPAEKVDQIMTEEEFKEIESTYGRFNPTLIRVIASHRTLYAANAELSFENMMRKRYEGFLKSIINNGETLNENDDFETFKTKINAWEDRP